MAMLNNQRVNGQFLENHGMNTLYKEVFSNKIHGNFMDEWDY